MEVNVIQIPSGVYKKRYAVCHEQKPNETSRKCVNCQKKFVYLLLVLEKFSVSVVAGRLKF